MKLNRRGQGASAFVANWHSSSAPFATKLRLVLRNNWRKLRTASSCCGNDGEPGC